MRPKGVPNKLTSAVKYKLDGIIDQTMESINVDTLTNAEKNKIDRSVSTICNAS